MQDGSGQQGWEVWQGQVQLEGDRAQRAAWRGQHETDTQVHLGWLDWCSRLEPDNTGLCEHGRNFLGYPTGGGKLLVGLRQAAG